MHGETIKKIKQVMFFYENMKSFFVNVLTEEALVTEVSSNAGISD
jgi:hypothetical protein